MEVIAARVTEAIREDIEALLAALTQRNHPTTTQSLTVQQLAAQLGVARSTVYAHWREWGGYKLGTGPKAPIRFNAHALPAACDGAAGSPAPRPRPSHRTPRRRRTRRELVEDAPRLAQLQDLLDGSV